MTVMVQIPNELAARLPGVGPDLERSVLEAIVLREFRAGRMTKPELRETLGFEVLDEVDSFLRAHEVWEPATRADIRRDQEDLRAFRRDG